MKKLIIIEEDTDARGMAVFTFENNGYEVVQSDKMMSVDEIAAQKPQIVVIGYTVNGTPGNDLCIDLKADPRTTTIPLILYSPSLDIAVISPNSCADGFVGKPMELDDFVYMVHRIAFHN
ncbi:MAG: hypothetical protein ABI203_00465 [Mucilaginibacter sp.]